MLRMTVASVSLFLAGEINCAKCGTCMSRLSKSSRSI